VAADAEVAADGERPGLEAAVIELVFLGLFFLVPVLFVALLFALPVLFMRRALRAGAEQFHRGPVGWPGGWDGPGGWDVDEAAAVPPVVAADVVALRDRLGHDVRTLDAGGDWGGGGGWGD
jgi:hypothetical protein